MNSISQEIYTRLLLCCGYTLTDFPISIRFTSLALWQSNDCPSASKATLMNMDKYLMWIHYERLHNHNKAKHNKTVCIFLGIYWRCGSVMLCVIKKMKDLLSHSGDLQVVLYIIRYLSSHKSLASGDPRIFYDDVIKWKHPPRDWSFVRSPLNSSHKGQWRGASMFSLICVGINAWVNNREAGDLRRHRAHYDVIVMSQCF